LYNKYILIESRINTENTGKKEIVIIKTDSLVFVEAKEIDLITILEIYNY